MHCFKSLLKCKIQSSLFLSYWVAFLFSKTMGLLALRYRLYEMGRCHISINAKITGWSNCYFGENCVIGARTWINVNNRVANEKLIRIGCNSFVGQDNFFTVGRLIVLGPYCLTASQCSFIGSTHVSGNPFSSYITTGTTNEDSIIIGANCFFGYGAMVLGNVKIGCGSIIGAGSVVRHDIPPFSLAVGNPAKVVKHFDFSINKWISGPRPSENSTEIPSEDEYIGVLKKNNSAPLQPLSAASSWLSDI